MIWDHKYDVVAGTSQVPGDTYVGPDNSGETRPTSPDMRVPRFSIGQASSAMCYAQAKKSYNGQIIWLRHIFWSYANSKESRKIEKNSLDRMRVHGL